MFRRQHSSPPDTYNQGLWNSCCYELVSAYNIIVFLEHIKAAKKKTQIFGNSHSLLSEIWTWANRRKAVSQGFSPVVAMRT